MMHGPESRTRARGPGDASISLGIPVAKLVTQIEKNDREFES